MHLKPANNDRWANQSAFPTVLRREEEASERGSGRGRGKIHDAPSTSPQVSRAQQAIGGSLRFITSNSSSSSIGETHHYEKSTAMARLERRRGADQRESDKLELIKNKKDSIHIQMLMQARSKNETDSRITTTATTVELQFLLQEVQSQNQCVYLPHLPWKQTKSF